MSAREVHLLLDAVGVSRASHPDTEDVLACHATRCGAPPSEAATAFLSRVIHGAWVRHEAFGELGLLTWPEIEECIDDQLDDPSMAHALPFGRDGGGRLTYLDPSLGFARDAVFVVSQGAPFTEDARRLATGLPPFLRALADGLPLEERSVKELREEQVREAPLSPKLGDGTMLPADLIGEATFHLGLHAVHEVRLRGDITIAGLRFAPGRTGADVAFFPDGTLERGRLAADQVVDDKPLAGGTMASWNRAGRLVGFTPRDVVTVRGVPCAPGHAVFDNPPTLFATPAADAHHRGWPCKAGHPIEDYGLELGMHLTTATEHRVADRVVPAGVRATVLADGGARFDLVDPFELEGELLPAGTHVWYGRQGAIREIYRRA
jgi:hypothetical protein